MITAWKDNLFSALTPGWVSCLDESVSTWMIKYIGPDLIFCLRKPYPFDNEYHIQMDFLGFYLILMLLKEKINTKRCVLNLIRWG